MPRRGERSQSGSRRRCETECSKAGSPHQVWQRAGSQHGAAFLNGSFVCGFGSLKRIKRSFSSSSPRNRLSVDVLQMDASLLLRSLLRGNCDPGLPGLSPALLQAAGAYLLQVYVLYIYVLSLRSVYIHTHTYIYIYIYIIYIYILMLTSVKLCVEVNTTRLCFNLPELARHGLH